MPEWRGQDSFAAEAAAFGEIDLKSRSERMPLTLSMRVISAPASFALPMVQRKVFKPPFMVRGPPAAARALLRRGVPQPLGFPRRPLHPVQGLPRNSSC